jgi:2-(1,2-epoxy-1,2-dihydrophenyl)acetyl-CoA isomerase
MAYSGIALTPDCGVSWLLPRVVGQQRALNLALTGRTLTADEAHAWGLVTEVVDDEHVHTRAQEVVMTLAQGPTGAFGEAKRLIRSSWAVSREHNARDEAATIARAVTTDDAKVLIGGFAGR